MQKTEQRTGWDGVERKRVEAVVATLTNLRSGGETLAEVAHDARNMVTALGLYCDLLEEPGVLATPYLHYADELRLVATASRRLVEKLVALDARTELRVAAPAADPVETAASAESAWPAIDAGVRARRERLQRWELLPAQPIENLAAELLANRNLLAALAGPAIALTIDAQGGSRAVRLTAEDLTRILVNLVKNAAEAMPAGGRIHIELRELPVTAAPEQWLSLILEDNGPGIAAGDLDKIFLSGYTTRASTQAGARRGLGLAITRSLVEAAGGRIQALNRLPSGTRFAIELPVRC